MKIKIWTLASDDDCGIRTEVFTTEREAEEAWVNAAVPDEDDNREARERLDRDGFNAVIDWAENEQMRDPMDTYTVEEHTIEVNPAAIIQDSAPARPSPDNLPPDPEEMNEERATSADETLDFFAQHHGELYPTKTDTERRQLQEQNAADLFCNFAHHCDRAGLSFRHILHMANIHYQQETDHQGTQEFSRLPERKAHQ